MKRTASYFAAVFVIFLLFAAGCSYNADRVVKKWGYMDTSGNMVIPPIYDTASDFSEGLAVVRTGGWSYYIDKTGKTLLGPYGIASSFSEGLAFVKNEKSKSQIIIGEEFPCKAINKKGEVVFEKEGCCANSSRFGSGLANVCDSTLPFYGLYGYINERGEWAIEPKYTWASPFYEGYAWAVVGSIPADPDRSMDWVPTWICLDSSGTELFAINAKYVAPFSEGVAVVQKDDQMGFVNTKGEWVLKPQVDYLGKMTNGVAWCWNNGKGSFVDSKGEVAFEIPENLGGITACYNSFYSECFTDRSNLPKFSEGFYQFFEVVPPFKKGYRSYREEDDIKKRNVYGFYRLDGSRLSTIELSDARSFCAGLAAVEVKIKKGKAK